MSATAPTTHDATGAAMAAELGAHTALLERVCAHLTPRAELSDTQTFAFPTGAANAFVFDVGVPALDPVEIEAWQSGAAAVPLFVLDGHYTQTQAARLVAATSSDFVPVVFAIPTTGIARVRLPTFSGELTICSLGSPTAVSLVTVRVRSCK